jgi:hypothetical protein
MLASGRGLRQRLRSERNGAVRGALAERRREWAIVGFDVDAMENAIRAWVIAMRWGKCGGGR